MVLDRLDADDVVERLAAFLDEALAGDDPLTAWLIASTPWAGRYLEARGQQYRIPRLEQAIAGRLDARLTVDAAVARTILAMVDGPRGVNAIAVAARTYTRIEIDRIARSHGIAA